jgi:hypothetical protein
MFIFVPIGRRFSATLRGSAVHQTKCESCSTEYLYLLRQTVHGGSMRTPFSPLGSEDRALANAQVKLDRALIWGNSPAPCPRCGRLQRDMIRTIKCRQSALPIVIVAICAIISFIACEDSWLKHRPAPGWPVWLIATSLAICGARLLKIWLKDFNHDRLSRLQQPLIDRYGATLKEDYLRGNRSLTGPATIGVLPNGWLRVDRDCLQLPEGICCNCGKSGASNGIYDLTPFSAATSSPELRKWNFPICSGCIDQIRNRRKQLIRRTVCAAIILGLALVAAALNLPGNSRDAKVEMLQTACYTLAAVTVTIPFVVWVLSSFLFVPVRVKPENPAKGTALLRFTYHEYIQVLETANRDPRQPKFDFGTATLEGIAVS